MENFKGTKGKWKLHKHAFACVVSDESSLLVSNCGGRTSNVNADQLYIEQQANAQLIAHAPEMLKKHYEEIGILEDILKNNPIGDVAFKLRMIIESKKDLLTRATTI